MRVDLKKFLFIGLEKEREPFFHKLQETGLVQIININPVFLKSVPVEVENLLSAMKILRGLPPVDQEETSDYAIADGLADKIIQLQNNTEKLEEEERVVNLEISRVEIFGDFSPDDLAYIENEGHRKIQFFCAKSGAYDHSTLPDGLVFVGSEHGLDYFISFQKELVQYPKMSEMKIPHPLGELKARKNQIEKGLRETDMRLKGYAKYNLFLHHALINKLNSYHLEVAKNSVEKTVEGELFAFEGWVPADQIDRVQKLVNKAHVHIEEIAIEPKDNIPTHLENTGVNRIGEDLVHIYDTPSHTDRDPSLWVLFFFSIFFGMVIGDGGYGLVFLAAALYIRYKHRSMKGMGLRIWKLFIILSFAAIAWGLFSSSFFGIHISQDNPVRKISVLNWLIQKKAAYHFEHKDSVYEFWVKKFPQLKDAQNANEFLYGAKKPGEIGEYEMYSRFSDNIMMEIALFIGVLHIVISFLRYLDRNLSGIGWIIFLIGSYLYVPYFLGATSIIHFAFGVSEKFGEKNGLYLVAGGFAIALFFAIIKHKLVGIFESMNVIQIFADVMSYLRLYALGLAGAMVMMTINEFAAQMTFVLGAFLFLIGHITNMALGIMGGVIHGLRLNFLEWYHYSFEGGGKMFNPLRLLKIE